MDSKQDQAGVPVKTDEAVPPVSATETDGEPEEKAATPGQDAVAKDGAPAAKENATTPPQESQRSMNPGAAGQQQPQNLVPPQQQPITIIVQQPPDSLDIKRYRGLFVTLIVISILSFLLCWTQYFICALTSILGVVAGAMGISPHQCCCNNTQKTHVTHIRGLLIATAFFSAILMCLAIALGISLLVNSNNYYLGDPSYVQIGGLLFNRVFVIVTGSLNLLNAVFLLTMLVVSAKLTCDIPPTDEQCCGETPDAPAMERYYYPPQQQQGQAPQIIVLGGGNLPPQFQQYGQQPQQMPVQQTVMRQ